MSYKWCSLFNMWCEDVEELIDAEGACDLECDGCTHAEEEN